VLCSVRSPALLRLMWIVGFALPCSSTSCSFTASRNCTEHEGRCEQALDRYRSLTYRQGEEQEEEEEEEKEEEEEVEEEEGEEAEIQRRSSACSQ